MKKTALVIMAAGIGSRFGGGIKQLEPVGPNGEIIMDYSIHDALEAGFNKVVFIIRKDLDKDFREIIGNRIEKLTEVAYAYQEVDDLPQEYKGKWNRSKPWGTGQALLAAKDVVAEPFIVINADDYYGKEAFAKIHEYLVNEMDELASPMDLCMAAFKLTNTLSENGGVTRGVCDIKDGKMVDVTETYEIRLKDGVLQAKGENGEDREVAVDSCVSMNMWGLPASFISVLETGFKEFLGAIASEDVKSEYLLPKIIDKMIKKGEAEVTALATEDKWFGVTYKEDKQVVVDSIRELIRRGLY
ncbi:MAG: sugar phosphate nucleotidyltransferase [Lachnospiraceae bacterium]|nr:sugar phosphate nucleotidyltransferase [Lachnospiraceae bacterium]